MKHMVLQHSILSDIGFYRIFIFLDSRTTEIRKYVGGRHARTVFGSMVHVEASFGTLVTGQRRCSQIPTYSSTLGRKASSKLSFSSIISSILQVAIYEFSAVALLWSERLSEYIYNSLRPTVKNAMGFCFWCSLCCDCTVV
jgi:hypothetical protein